MVSYDRLWETMKKNMYVSTHTIDMLCNILQCSVEDVMEIRLDDPQKSERKK